jgi:hypothetical protein
MLTNWRNTILNSSNWLELSYEAGMRGLSSEMHHVLWDACALF